MSVACSTVGACVPPSTEVLGINGPGPSDVTLPEVLLPTYSDTFSDTIVECRCCESDSVCSFEVHSSVLAVSSPMLCSAIAAAKHAPQHTFHWKVELQRQPENIDSYANSRSVSDSFTTKHRMKHWDPCDLMHVRVVHYVEIEVEYSSGEFEIRVEGLDIDIVKALFNVFYSEDWMLTHTDLPLFVSLLKALKCEGVKHIENVIYHSYKNLSESDESIEDARILIDSEEVAMCSERCAGLKMLASVFVSSTSEAEVQSTLDDYQSTVLASYQVPPLLRVTSCFVALKVRYVLAVLQCLKPPRFASSVTVQSSCGDALLPCFRELQGDRSTPFVTVNLMTDIIKCQYFWNALRVTFTLLVNESMLNVIETTSLLGLNLNFIDELMGNQIEKTITNLAPMLSCFGLKQTKAQYVFNDNVNATKKPTQRRSAVIARNRCTNQRTKDGETVKYVDPHKPIVYSSGSKRSRNDSRESTSLLCSVKSGGNNYEMKPHNVKIGDLPSKKRWKWTMDSTGDVCRKNDATSGSYHFAVEPNYNTFLNGKANVNNCSSSRGLLLSCDNDVSSCADVDVAGTKGKSCRVIRNIIECVIRSSVDNSNQPQDASVEGRDTVIENLKASSTSGSAARCVRGEVRCTIALGRFKASSSVGSEDAHLESNEEVVRQDVMSPATLLTVQGGGSRSQLVTALSESDVNNYSVQGGGSIAGTSYGESLGMCPGCSLRFVAPQDLLVHMQQQHMTNVSKTRGSPCVDSGCPVPIRAFNEVAHLLKHVVQSQNKCRFCSFSCRTKGGLSRHHLMHQRAVHKKAAGRPDVRDSGGGHRQDDGDGAGSEGTDTGDEDSSSNDPGLSHSKSVCYSNANSMDVAQRFKPDAPGAPTSDDGTDELCFTATEPYEVPVARKGEDVSAMQTFQQITQQRKARQQRQRPRPKGVPSQHLGIRLAKYRKLDTKENTAQDIANFRPPSRCFVCGLVFEEGCGPVAMALHYYNTHRRLVPLPCPFPKCPLVLRQAALMLDHVHNHLWRGRYSCTACSYSANTTKTIKLHARAHEHVQQRPRMSEHKQRLLSSMLATRARLSGAGDDTKPSTELSLAAPALAARKFVHIPSPPTHLYASTQPTSSFHPSTVTSALKTKGISGRRSPPEGAGGAIPQRRGVGRPVGSYRRGTDQQHCRPGSDEPRPGAGRRESNIADHQTAPQQQPHLQQESFREFCTGFSVSPSVTITRKPLTTSTLTPACGKQELENQRASVMQDVNEERCQAQADVVSRIISRVSSSVTVVPTVPKQPLNKRKSFKPVSKNNMVALVNRLELQEPTNKNVRLFSEEKEPKEDADILMADSGTFLNRSDKLQDRSNDQSNDIKGTKLKTFSASSGQNKLPLKTDDSGKNFCQAYSLKLSTKRRAPDSFIKCPHCLEARPSAVEIWQHFVDKHLLKSEFFCPLCMFHLIPKNVTRLGRNNFKEDCLKHLHSHYVDQDGLANGVAKKKAAEDSHDSNDVIPMARILQEIEFHKKRKDTKTADNPVRDSNEITDAADFNSNLVKSEAKVNQLEFISSSYSIKPISPETSTIKSETEDMESPTTNIEPGLKGHDGSAPQLASRDDTDGDDVPSADTGEDRDDDFVPSDDDFEQMEVDDNYSPSKTRKRKVKESSLHGNAPSSYAVSVNGFNTAIDQCLDEQVWTQRTTKKFVADCSSGNCFERRAVPLEIDVSSTPHIGGSMTVLVPPTNMSSAAPCVRAATDSTTPKLKYVGFATFGRKTTHHALTDEKAETKETLKFLCEDVPYFSNEDIPPTKKTYSQIKIPRISSRVRLTSKPLQSKTFKTMSIGAVATSRLTFPSLTSSPTVLTSQRPLTPITALPSVESLSRRSHSGLPPNTNDFSSHSSIVTADATTSHFKLGSNGLNFRSAVDNCDLTRPRSSLESADLIISRPILGTSPISTTGCALEASNSLVLSQIKYSESDPTVKPSFSSPGMIRRGLQLDSRKKIVCSGSVSDKVFLGGLSKDDFKLPLNPITRDGASSHGETAADLEMMCRQSEGFESPFFLGQKIEFTNNNLILSHSKITGTSINSEQYKQSQDVDDEDYKKVCVVSIPNSLNEEKCEHAASDAMKVEEMESLIGDPPLFHCHPPKSILPPCFSCGPSSAGPLQPSMFMPLPGMPANKPFPDIVAASQELNKQAAVPLTAAQTTANFDKFNSSLQSVPHFFPYGGHLATGWPVAERNPTWLMQQQQQQQMFSYLLSYYISTGGPLAAGEVKNSIP